MGGCWTSRVWLVPGRTAWSAGPWFPFPTIIPNPKSEIEANTQMLEQGVNLLMMEVVSPWDTRTMWTYAANIWRLSNRTFHGSQREFVRQSGSDPMSGGRSWEEMQGNLAVRNHTNLSGSKKPQKSKSHQELRKLNTGCGSTNLICKEGRRTAAIYGLPHSQQTDDEEPISSHTDLGPLRLDLRTVYHLIRINGGDQYNSAFRIHFNSNQRRWVIGKAMTVKSRDDPTGTEILIYMMTLPGMPEWRIRVHLMTEKSSGHNAPREQR